MAIYNTIQWNEEGKCSDWRGLCEMNRAGSSLENDEVSGDICTRACCSVVGFPGSASAKEPPSVGDTQET